MPAPRMRCFYQNWMAMSLLALAACAPDFTAETALQNIASLATGKAFEAPHAQWPHDAWWQDYRDPQLATMMEEALAHSPSLAMAQGRLRQATGQAKAAGSALLPTSSASIAEGYSKQSYHNGVPASFVPHGWKDGGRAALDISYEIDFWGKNRASIAAATSENEAAKADMAQARLMLTTGIAASYAELAKLYADRDAAEEALQVRRATLRLFLQRNKNGLENKSSVKQAESGEATAQAELHLLDERIALQKNALAALMGAGPDRSQSIARPTIVLSRAYGLPHHLALSLLGRRPDIVASRLRAEAARKRVDVAEAGFYPNVNLSTMVGLQALGIENLTQKGSDIGSSTAAMTLPIFSGGRLEGAYGSAWGEYDMAVAGYNATLTHALREVADVATTARFLANESAYAAAAHDASRQAHAIAQKRYRGGLSTYLDVLNAENQMIATRRALADMQSRLFVQDVALVRALGGGYQHPAAMIPAARTTKESTHD